MFHFLSDIEEDVEFATQKTLGHRSYFMLYNKSIMRMMINCSMLQNTMYTDPTCSIYIFLVFESCHEYTVPKIEGLPFYALDHPLEFRPFLSASEFVYNFFFHCQTGLPSL